MACLSELLWAKQETSGLTKEEHAIARGGLEQIAGLQLWLETETHWTAMPFWQRLTWTAFAPFYLYRTAQKWDTNLTAVLEHLRHIACLHLTMETVDKAVFMRWLEQPTCRTVSPSLLLRDKFQLDLAEVSHRFWGLILKDTPIEARYARWINTSTEICPGDKEEVIYWHMSSAFIQPLDTDEMIDLPNTTGVDLETSRLLHDRVEIVEHFNRLKAAVQSCGQIGCNSDLKSQTRFQPQVLEQKPSLLPHTSLNNTFHMDHADVDVAPGLGMKTEELEMHKPIVHIPDRHSQTLSQIIQKELSKSQRPEDSVSVALLKKLDGEQPEQTKAPEWFERAHQIISASLPREDFRALTTDESEFVLIFRDLDRTEVTTLIRELLETIQRNDTRYREFPSATLLPSDGIYIAGVATVVCPVPSFTASQLIEAAWRCLSATETQGIGGLKSIQVF